MFNKLFNLICFFYINCVIIFFWTCNRKRWLQLCSKTSLFCFFSCFKLCEFVRWTISTLFRNFCSCNRSFATLKTCCESSLNCLCVELWSISEFCLMCLTKSWIYMSWHQNNFLCWISWKLWCVQFWNKINDNSIRHKFKINSLTKTLILCTEFSKFCSKYRQILKRCLICNVW